MLIAKPSCIVSHSPLKCQNFTVASHSADPGALSPELVQGGCEWLERSQGADGRECAELLLKV